MSVNELSSVRALLDQWLLLPLFADIGMIVLVTRSVRNRAGHSLAALLGLLALDDMALIWPELPGASHIAAACAAFLPALALLFILSYAGGRSRPGRRGWMLLAIMAPPVAFTTASAGAGLPAGNPLAPSFSLAFFGAAIVYILLTGTARSLARDEAEFFMAAVMLLAGAGPVYDLALPLVGIDLPFRPYFFAAAGAMLTQSTLRYKAFSLAPAALRPGPGGNRLPAGIFMAGTGEGRRARRLLADAVRAGTPGAAVTRAHPAALRRDIGAPGLPVVWLANSSYEKALPPARVEVLSHILRDMGEESPGCLVLVEDLDYIVTNAGLFPVLDALSDVRPRAERARMAVVLCSDLLTDGERRELRGIGVLPLPPEDAAPAQSRTPGWTGPAASSAGGPSPQASGHRESPPFPAGDDHDTCQTGRDASCMPQHR
jgi:hypothetical protein